MPPKNGKELTSNWDQFCDFTSLVGFRLLHSNQPLWVRIVAASVMFLCSFFICFQSLYFWDKFRQSAGQRIATVTETEGQPMRQPRFLVCVGQQSGSLLRSRGESVDFRQLLQNEMGLVNKFLNSSSNSSTSVLQSAGIALSKNIHLLVEIGTALRFDYANFTLPKTPDEMQGKSEGMSSKLFT
ncbi:hypothetical protein niasHT_028188 [Heterodera trifolii]|uniref:Uncharacterized protein n=1 Tax=Heterodera trifolii TaxID=157864 RepID=A0ABD2JNW7_9BILA